MEKGFTARWVPFFVLVLHEFILKHYPLYFQIICKNMYAAKYLSYIRNSQ